MIKFTELYKEYKLYVESNSKYNVKVVKNYNYDSTYFPIIDFSYENTTNSNNSTIDRIEYYDNEYFQITLYVKDDGNISRNVITEELIQLTRKFMEGYKNMYRTSCRPIPNLDTSVLRTVIEYQCQVGNVYGNIIRRG